MPLQQTPPNPSHQQQQTPLKHLLGTPLHPTLQQWDNHIEKLLGTPLKLPVNSVCIAAWNGNAASMKTALQRFPKQLHSSCTSTGAYPLQVAAAFAYAPIVHLLLQAGAKPNKTGTLALPPLLIAAASPFAEAHQVIQLLLRAKARKSSKLKSGATALHMAAASASPFAYRSIEVLLKAKLNKNATDKQRQTPLMQAVQQGHWHNTKTLLQHNVKTHLKDKQGRTAWEMAKQRNDPQHIQLLRLQQSNAKHNKTARR